MSPVAGDRAGGQGAQRVRSASLAAICTAAVRPPNRRSRGRLGHRGGQPGPRTGGRAGGPTGGGCSNGRSRRRSSRLTLTVMSSTTPKTRLVRGGRPSATSGLAAPVARAVTSFRRIVTGSPRPVWCSSSVPSRRARVGTIWAQSGTNRGGTDRYRPTRTDTTGRSNHRRKRRNPWHCSGFGCSPGASCVAPPTGFEPVPPP